MNTACYGYTPLHYACEDGRLGCIQLLSSYGASRTFLCQRRHDGGAHAATEWGHDDIAAWLAATRNWTPLHHLEVLTPERALALLRAGADPGAAAGPAGRRRSRSRRSWRRRVARRKARRRSSSSRRRSRGAARRTSTSRRRRARSGLDLFLVAQLIKRGEAAYEADGVRFDFIHPRSPTSSRNA